MTSKKIIKLVITFDWLSVELAIRGCVSKLQLMMPGFDSVNMFKQHL